MNVKCKNVVGACRKAFGRVSTPARIRDPPVSEPGAKATVFVFIFKILCLFLGGA